MTNLLDISIHGPQRVEIVEQLVHICRYTPGLVLLEGDAGRSPVNFLRHMADLLRDELDFALLDTGHCDLAGIAAELITQWFIYQSEEHEQTDIQSIHHYLDLGLQSGRLALIVIERSSLLTDESINFLVGMMARHSRLTILFAGITDTRPLLRRAQQAEVPVHRIDLHDSVSPAGSFVAQPAISEAGTYLSASGFDHKFSDDSYELPDEDLFEDDLYEPDVLVAELRGRREPVIGEQYGATLSPTRPDVSDLMLGVSTRLSAVQEWGAATLASIKEKKRGGGLLLLGCAVLGILLLLLVRNSRDVEVVSNGESAVRPVVVSGGSPVQSQALPNAATSALTGSSPEAAVVPAQRSEDIQSTVQPTLAEASVAPVSKPVLQEDASVAPMSKPVPQEKVVVGNPEQAGLASQNKPAARALRPNPIKVEPAAQAAPVTERSWRSKPDNFTVQIAAAHGEANIRKLERKLPPGQPHYVYRTTREGKPWFILIYGSFSSKKDASMARSTLAASIQKDSTPWVRKQGEVFAQ